MPEMIQYKVTQERVVEVTANSLPDAILIAQAAFEHGQNSGGGVAAVITDDVPELQGIWGNTTSRIRETSLHGERLR